MHIMALPQHAPASRLLCEQSKPSIQHNNTLSPACHPHVTSNQHLLACCWSIENAMLQLGLYLSYRLACACAKRL